MLIFRDLQSEEEETSRTQNTGEGQIAQNLIKCVLLGLCMMVSETSPGFRALQGDKSIPALIFSFPMLVLSHTYPTDSQIPSFISPMSGLQYRM